jgi:hypothetical protein
MFSCGPTTGSVFGFAYVVPDKMCVDSLFTSVSVSKGPFLRNLWVVCTIGTPGVLDRSAGWTVGTFFDKRIPPGLDYMVWA